MDQSDMFLSMIPKAESDVAAAVRALHEWKCCPRCILRFLGDKEIFSYRKSREELEEWLGTYLNKKGKGQVCDGSEECKTQDSEATPNSKTAGNGVNEASNTPNNDVVCITCIGVLQDKYCSEKFCQELLEIIKKENFQFETYYLSLSIPVPLIMREYAVFIKLKELLPKVYEDYLRDDITPLKEAWKWASGPIMTSLLGVPFDQRSDFEVKLDFVHPDLTKDCTFLFDLYPDVFRKRKNNKHGWEVFTRVNVPRALEDMGEAKFRKYFQCPPRPMGMPCECDPITCTHEAIFVAGRYNKYSRELSQTPWLVDSGRRTDSSIQEMICETLEEAVRCKEYKLSASGREDVDVLMLGRGRPFVVEFINPRRIRFTREEMKELQNKINTSHKEVRVRDLQIVNREDLSNLKKGEEEKIKTYSALCCIDKDITQEDIDCLNSIKDLVVKQKTPVRVLHRRALAVRDKTIHSMLAKLKDNRHFLLNMSTQAGTYIKEFVHGDFGRSVPNLGTLLNAECDILELNVEAIELDWPTQLEDFDETESG